MAPGAGEAQSYRARLLGADAPARRAVAAPCAHLSSLSPEATWRHHLRQEPDAVIPLVRIRGEGYEQSSSLLRLRGQSRFAKGQRQEQAYEGDREQDAERRQDGRESPAVDPIAHEGAQETEGGADSQIRHGDHGRAERGGDPLVERLQEEHPAQAPADLAQGPEQY